MAKKKSALNWSKAKAAPIVLLSGGEDALVRKAQDLITAQVRKAGDYERTRLDANHYEPGALLQACAPSLFSSSAYVTVDNLATMTDDFLADALQYAADPNPDAVVVFKHSGGNRGAKLLKALEAQGVEKYDCQALKTDAAKQEFAAAEFKRAGRTIEPAALDALLAALASDVSELSAGIDQLLADTTGTITQEIVDRYYAGRIEATGFKVADAAVAGRSTEALGLLRHALATGTDPVPIVAVVAMKLRQLATVHGLSGSPGQLAAELKMAPWQVDRAKRELRQWNDVALGEALMWCAAADEAVKGGGRDPEYAVEALVLKVSNLARRR